MVWNHHRSFYPHLIWKKPGRDPSQLGPTAHCASMKIRPGPAKKGQKVRAQNTTLRFPSGFLGSFKIQHISSGWRIIPTKTWVKPQNLMVLVGGFSSFNPFEKYAKVKLDTVFPQGFGVENEKMFELPPTSWWFFWSMFIHSSLFQVPRHC